MREKAEDFISILQDKVSTSREACDKVEVRWKGTIPACQLLMFIFLQNDGKESDRLLQEELNKLRAEQQSKRNLRDDRQTQLVSSVLFLRTHAQR